MLEIKIGSIRQRERYILRRIVAAAQCELQSELPGLDARVSELRSAQEITKYAFMLVLPTLVIGEKVVCSGRFPEKDEVKLWLREAAMIDAPKRA